MIGENNMAGTVCIEIVDDATKFQVNYTASSDWTLVTTEFWIGENISLVPIDDEGALDTDEFPYFYCNSTGEDSWTAKFDLKWSYNCLDLDQLTLAVIGQATVAQVNTTSGEIIEDSEVVAFAYEYESTANDTFGWFDIVLNSICVDEEEPSEKTVPSTPEICVKTDNATSFQECHSVYATDSVVAGTICVEVAADSDYLEVSFEANENWLLITTEFWVGDDVASVPSDNSTGDLDIEGFPYFWCNSTGEESHTTQVDLKWKYLCDDMNEFSLAVVAQLTLGQIGSDGELMEGTEMVSFATEFDAQAGEDIFGWFDVAILCECVPPEEETVIGLCVETKDPSKQECHEVYAGDSTSIGTVCVKVTDDDEHMEVSFEASDDWLLTTTDLWVGENATGVPVDDDGELDIDNFPYFWCNSTGEGSHTTDVDFKWSYLCQENDGAFHVAVVARMTVSRISESGEASEGTEVISFASEYEMELGDDIFGYFDVPIDCECPKSVTVTDRSASTPVPDICVETGDIDDECHDLLADGQVAGSVCIKLLDSSTLEVTYEAKDDWLFTDNEIWIGEEISSVPLDGEGDLDTENFPFFWCNSTGEASWSSKVNFKWAYMCEGEDQFSLAMLSRSTLGKLDANGEVSDNTTIAFTDEFQTTEGAAFGWFDFTIKCDCPEEKPESPSNETGCDGDVLITQEVEVGDSGQELAMVESHSFTIPSGADSADIKFILHQQGDWDMDTKVVATLDGVEVDLGALEDYDRHVDPTNAQSGIVNGDISWSRQRVLDSSDHTDKWQEVVISAPSDYFASGSLSIKFDLVPAQNGAIAAISDFTITANGNWCETDVRRLGGGALDDSSLPCKKDVEIAREDFETGTAAGWNNGLIALDDKFGHFLGRLGRENRAMSKVFTVPMDAQSVRIGFSIYTMGTSTWKMSDQFHAKVGIADVNFGDFTHSSKSGTTQGIAWHRTIDQEDANKHHISLEVPTDYFIAGKLTLAFEVFMKESIARKSAGVDNLIIIAVGLDRCGDSGSKESIIDGASGFRVSSFTATEPDIDGDDEEGRGYCRSEDFPCGEEDGMVYVCHYSITSGYMTYCLKESDSDLVRTYPDDYCGPCVGGYGSMHQGGP